MNETWSFRFNFLFIVVVFGAQLASGESNKVCMESLTEKLESHDSMNAEKNDFNFEKAFKRILYNGHEQLNTVVSAVEDLRKIPNLKMNTPSKIYMPFLQEYLGLFEASGKDVLALREELSSKFEVDYKYFIRFILRLTYSEGEELVQIRFGNGNMGGLLRMELRLNPYNTATDESLERYLRLWQIELFYGDAQEFPHSINFPFIAKSDSFGVALMNQTTVLHGINPCIITTNNLEIHGSNFRPSMVFAHDLSHGILSHDKSGLYSSGSQFGNGHTVYDRDHRFLELLEKMPNGKEKLWFNLAFYLLQREIVNYWDFTSGPPKAYYSFYDKIADLASLIKQINPPNKTVKSKANIVNNFLASIVVRNNNIANGYNLAISGFFIDLTKHQFLKNIVQDPSDVQEVSEALYLYLYELASAVDGQSEFSFLFW